MRITEEQISALRQDVGKMMSGFRLEHTLGVEKMAARLARLYCPEKELMLRAAALLHDITKELTVPEQIKIYERYGKSPSKEELAAPATLHSVTASLIIPEKYPELADEQIISEVRYHTTGREGMSLCEKLIYLADYIDETRKYDDCIALREEFFSASPEKMDEKEKTRHLNRVILHSFDMTIRDLIERGKVLSSDTVRARNGIIFELESN